VGLPLLPLYDIDSDRNHLALFLFASVQIKMSSAIIDQMHGYFVLFLLLESRWPRRKRRLRLLLAHNERSTTYCATKDRVEHLSTFLRSTRLSISL
jgi:hypothetical protein